MKLSSARIIVPTLSLVLAGAVLVACKNAARRDGVGAAALVESGSAQESSQATSSAENEYRILARGEDHSVFGKVTEYRKTNGTPFYVTNRYTVLENGLNYQENGQWQTSEDVIENFAEGAIARRGPHKGIFAHDLNADAVFDLQSSTGVRLRGGVRSIHLTDSANGRSVLLGSVKAQAPGELLPPNRIVYRDAFEGGVRADVLLVWKHNAFAQDVILRSRPVLPDGFAPESTRLEIVTEFMQPPQPEISQTRPDARRPDLIDDRFIRFGKLNIIGGQAFPVEGGAAVSLGADNPPASATPVAKQWDVLDDGRTVLIESTAWEELLPHLEQLPMAAAESGANSRTALALQREVPKRSSTVTALKPLQLASSAYKPKGYLIDFLVVPDEISNNTFVTGETYAVRTSYYASSATFQPGCIIKNYSLGRIVLTGSFTFPDTLQSCVFTSIDDDTFGERISDAKTNLIRESNGNPALDRPNALLEVRSLNAATEVRSSLFRWGVYGLSYFQTAASSTHTVRNCRFENFQSASGSIAAMHISIPTSSTVSLVTSDMANVDVQKYDPASRVTGSLSLANFYTDKRFAGQNWLGWRSYTPDCMGAAGPNHFVQIINDWIRVYTKGGTIVSGDDMTMSYFFLRYTPVDAQDVRMIDPRIIYDFQSQAWAGWDLIDNRTTRRSILSLPSKTVPIPLPSQAGPGTPFPPQTRPGQRTGQLSRATKMAFTSQHRDLAPKTPTGMMS